MVIAKGIINITQGDNDFFDTPKTIHSVECRLSVAISFAKRSFVFSKTIKKCSKKAKPKNKT